MRVLCGAFVGVLALSTLVRAQSTTATLGGTVLDESSAVVPDAKIAVVNLDTGLRRETTADARGSFVVALLSPGRYRVTAERDGFTLTEIAALDLNVGDNLALRLVLKIPSVDQSVTVSAEATRVSTSSAVSTVVDRTFVGSLPLNGRSFQSLITMTPGVVLTKATSTSPGQFSVNGQRSDANYFMVDGVSANVGVQSGTAMGVQGAGAAPGLSAAGGTNSLVSVDALQEFRIESSTYAPEFGRVPGGQVSMVTRSGTNQYHGALFEYFRNDALDSADYFVTRQGLAKPRENQHDFGGVFGGPIQRDRMFVFVSYEGLRLDQPTSAVTEVPSLASRAAASPAIAPFFAAFPLPNGPVTANGLAQFSASYSNPATLDATSVRIDQTLGSTLSVFGRYNYAPSEASSRTGSFATDSINTIGTLQNSLQTVTAGAAWTISSTLSNDLRFNWSRNVGNNFRSLDTFGGAVLPPPATFHPPIGFPQTSYQFNLRGVNANLADAPNAFNTQRQINVVDALQLTKDKHQIKVGVDFRRLFLSYNPFLKYVQVYAFSGATGALAGTAASASFSAAYADNSFPHASSFSSFAQDSWSATSRLTFTYGLRWDVNPPPALNGSTSALTLTSADPATMALAAPGTPMFKTRWTNFAPRVGAAYQLRDHSQRPTVLRGGWGIFFDLGIGMAMDNFTSFPFAARRNLVNIPFPADPSLVTPPTIAPGAPVDFLVAPDPNVELPYTHEWNVAIEQGVGASSTVSVSYVGALGQRLLREELLLNPTPQIQNLTLITNRGHSRYDALQIKYARRLSAGFQALASYTLANSKDNISNDTLAVFPSVRFDPEEDWGPSDYDVRHTLSGAVTYALPSPRGPSVWRAIFGGWSTDTVFTARSALPVNVVTGTTVFGVSSALRPDGLTGIPLSVDDSTVPGGQRFNRAAFAPPPLDASGNPLRQGTLDRNALRGFGMSQVDLAVRRDIRLGGGTNLQLSVEAFNLFNQVNFGLPTNTLSSGLFGQPTQTLAPSLAAGGVAGGGFSPLYQVGGPRSIQLALRLQF